MPAVATVPEATSWLNDNVLQPFLEETRQERIEENLGYDVTSLDLESGDPRLIEVKGLAAQTGTILLTPNEKRVAEDRRDCYWLYVVTNCLPTEAAAQAGATEPMMQEPIKDPARFPWHEVTKVAHYWLEVNAMSLPMKVREDQRPYGKRDRE